MNEQDTNDPFLGSNSSTQVLPPATNHRRIKWHKFGGAGTGEVLTDEAEAIRTKTEDDLHLEEAYQQIGWWKGPKPPSELRRENQKFWATAGEKGIHWLVARLRPERNIEVLHGAASLLASLGPVVVLPILDELDGTRPGDNGLALLGALGKLSPNVGRAHLTRLSNTLCRYLRHPLLELREAAATASAILPALVAVDMLKGALRAETRAVVRETLEDAIAERLEEQD
jgi:hypothetical protein